MVDDSDDSRDADLQLANLNTGGSSIVPELASALHHFKGASGVGQRVLLQ